MSEYEVPVYQRDPGSMSHAERIATLVELQRVRSAVEAAELRLLQAVRDEPVSAGEAAGKDYCLDEVAVALSWDDGWARSRFGLVRSLTERLPGVLDALAQGRISGVQAAAIDRGIPGDVPQAVVGRIEASVLGYAPTHTLGQTCRKVKRDVNRQDPGAFARQARSARAARKVWARPSDPGMARVGADLPAEGAAELMAAIDLLAGIVPPAPDFDGSADSPTAAAAPVADGRSKEQRRADALVQMGRDVLARGCSHCQLPKRPIGPAVNVTMTLPTLLQLQDTDGQLNGEPIPAELARALAGDEHAVWRRWITTPLGRPIDLATDNYRPGAKLRAFITARHQRCAFPGCHRRATSCDIGHVTPWPQGDTAPWNLIPQCERHHHLKHEAAGWTVRMFGDGTVQWTTPTGQIIEVEPDSYPVDTTFDPIDVRNDNDPTDWAAALIAVQNDNQPQKQHEEPPPF